MWKRDSAEAAEGAKEMFVSGNNRNGTGELSVVANIDAKLCEAPLQSTELNIISGQIVDAAIKVHSVLGPGLLESTYTACLAQELRLRSLGIRMQVPVPIQYRGVFIRVG
jgi:hypothetical protein